MSKQQDGFSAVSERQSTDEESSFTFACAVACGAAGLVATLIFALLGHAGSLSLAIG